MKKLLIIEDEQDIQMILEDHLYDEGYDVTIVGEGIKGEKTAREGKWDLILLDIMLPGKDGLSICHRLRKNKIKTPIIMVTARGGDIDIITGLREGADDYIAKPFNLSILSARIEALLRRTAEESPKEDNTFSFGNYYLNFNSETLRKGEKIIPLNRLEYGLLFHMVKNRTKIISRDNLLNEVWGYDSNTTSRTIDVHIAKLRSKLGESAIPRHIQTIRGRGYRFIP